MPLIFRLYWLRETGCNAGTPIQADAIEPAIRERVLTLARENPSQEDPSQEELILRLPFLDKIEWPRRAQILDGLRWQRRGNEISPELPPNHALRDRAAHLVLADPAWIATPDDRDLTYFRVWQRVSMDLQQCLRNWVADIYFQDLSRYEDRASAFTVLVYQAARIWHGKPRTEFTYDFRDYPERDLTLRLATKMTASTLQAILAETEQRLRDAGLPLLANRYTPAWQEDILREVCKKPRKLVKLLARECAFINAVIDLGSHRSVAGINRFARTAGLALRNVYGMDLRHLGLRALDRATEVLHSTGDGMVEKSDSLPHT